MTTPLNKQVKRITSMPHRGRRTVVILAPGDVIGFRAERTRSIYWISLAACFDMAVKLEVAAQKAARRKGKR